MEWQKYDTYTAASQRSTAVAYARPLNLARIQTFSVSKIGKGLAVLDVGCGDGVISKPISKLGNNVTSIDLPTITRLAHKRRVKRYTPIFGAPTSTIIVLFRKND